MNDLTFKLNELISLRDSINVREQELENSLTDLRIAKRKINGILSEHRGDKNLVIILSNDVFNNIKSHRSSTKRNFSWKKVAIDVIKNSNSSLTTSMIYEKAKIKFPIELADRVKGIHGFSAALSYLIAEKKITKSENEKKTYYKIITKE